MADKPASLIAQEHWDWVATWLRMMYIDAFVHGYKHGVEEGIRDYTNAQFGIMNREELERLLLKEG